MPPLPPLRSDGVYPRRIMHAVRGRCVHVKSSAAAMTAYCLQAADCFGKSRWPPRSLITPVTPTNFTLYFWCAPGVEF